MMQNFKSAYQHGHPAVLTLTLEWKQELDNEKEDITALDLGNVYGCLAHRFFFFEKLKFNAWTMNHCLFYKTKSHFQRLK